MSSERGLALLGNPVRDLSFFGLPRTRDLAIDLGTANTLVYVPGHGIVVDEPSVVAIGTVDGVRRVLAVGSDAKVLMGKTPDNIETHRPLTDCVINDLEIAKRCSSISSIRPVEAAPGCRVAPRSSFAFLRARLRSSVEQSERQDSTPAAAKCG